ncbi:MAG: hypothetical protein Ct9H300mP14_14470 [Gammaproteobacteria bacterium]|nr:MAG: hypothetical protein Ct9H300mP14_14470 [Gammaproteobacteria bacterium]
MGFFSSDLWTRSSAVLVRRVYSTYSETFSPNPRPTPLAIIITPLLRSPTFWCLVVAFACFSLNHSMIISHILPLLDSPGGLNKLCSDRGVIDWGGAGTGPACSYHGRTPPIHASNLHVFFYRPVACQC